MKQHNQTQRSKGFPQEINSRQSMNAPLPKRHMAYLQSNKGTVTKILRQEHKYVVSPIQLKQCIFIVKNIMQEDKNNGLDGYMVRSLYFDTADNYDYTTKMDGVDVRRKIRLRIYDTNSEYAKLEMKQKQSFSQMKRTIKIKREDAVQMCKGIYTSLLYYDDPFALECYSLMSTRGYLPKSIVQYQRSAFLAEGNETRITFDEKLAATESCFDLFAHKLCLYPIMDLYNAVIEVKYNKFLYSYINDLLQGLDKSPEAVSKYCMARKITLG